MSPIDDDALRRIIDEDDEVWTGLRGNHFDKQGREMTLLEWVVRREDIDYVHVGSDYCDDVWVSTVWIGIDHDFRPTPHRPIIFETMVFGGPLDQAMNRYATEEAAIAGHAEILADVRLAAVAEADPENRY